MTDAPVQRYDCYCDFDYTLSVEKCESGDFVFYADHADRIEALEAKVKRYVTLLDHQMGTPCEQIRHQQEVEALEAENARLAQALSAAEEMIQGMAEDLAGMDDDDVSERARAKLRRRVEAFRAATKGGDDAAS